MATKSADPVDRHVGARIRTQRIMCGLSQIDLGNAVGVTFQQVQKYERGANRVSASRLQQIATVLRATPELFFDGAPTRAGSNVGSEELAAIDKFISSREGIALSQAFLNISGAKIRRSIVALVKQIAGL
jgi:transcriptional regulator with XRE-family HTH domain